MVMVFHNGNVKLLRDGIHIWECKTFKGKQFINEKDIQYGKDIQYRK